MKTDVTRCARCGQDHNKLEFEQFNRPVVDESGIWSHWTMCPVENAPILLKVINESPNSDEIVICGKYRAMILKLLEDGSEHKISQFVRDSAYKLLDEYFEDES